MLNEQELELLSLMDYQVLNNGMFGWLSNHCYENIFDYISILNKRNSLLDQQVATIFKKATLAGLVFHQYNNSRFIPEFEEITSDAEKKLEECGKQYGKIAEEFMRSYGLEDYLSKFENNFKLSDESNQ